MRRFGDKLNETVNRQNINEFHRVWIDCSFEINDDVASEQNGVSKRRQSIQEVRKLKQKNSGRAWSIKNDGNDE